MNKVIGSFSEDDFAGVNTTIADYMDAAFEIGTPTQMTVHLEVRVRATDNGNQFQYNFSMTLHAYHASTVNDIMEANIDYVLAEWEDCVTDSGKYANIAAGDIDGTIHISVEE